ncbi:MAG: hypothetical protein HZA24_01400 [Nitrospirae bacterium]|nr:hypothetical protein [Nitrospirota bacterium]
MKHRGIITVGVLAAAVVCAAAPAHAMDMALLKLRLTPTQADQDRRYDRLQVDAGYWQDDRALLAARQSRAMRVSQTYVLENLQDWAKDTPLEGVERLRRTDLKLGSGAPARMFGQDVNLSVRVAETLRLRVTAQDFSRDILYDPVGQRMWVDVFQVALPERRTGLKLTNTYRLDNDSTNLILKIQHQLE